MSNAPKLKPSASISGGNPSGLPDFRPLNPWGRPMPPPERGPRPKLYQIFVIDLERGRKVKPVFPQMERQFADMLCGQIREQITCGAERRWSDPVVIEV